MILPEWNGRPEASNTLGALLDAGAARLARVGIPAPRREAERLLAHVLGLERATLWRLSAETVLDPGRVRRWRRLLHRRASGEPLAYLLGRRQFWSLELRIRPGVLVPRPETEALVAAADALLQASPRARLLDLGTGSGALALALATLFPQAEIWATDRSPEAIALAAENARLMGRKIHLRQGDWYGALPAALRFRLVVANPPYLASDDPALGSDGLRREPRTALVAARGGLADLETIVGESPLHLEAGGWLLLEHAPRQTPSVVSLLERSGFTSVVAIVDPSGSRVGTRGRLRQEPPASGLQGCMTPRDMAMKYAR